VAGFSCDRSSVSGAPVRSSRALGRRNVGATGWQCHIRPSVWRRVEQWASNVGWLHDRARPAHALLDVRGARSSSWPAAVSLYRGARSSGRDSPAAPRSEIFCPERVAVTTRRARPERGVMAGGSWNGTSLAGDAPAHFDPWSKYFEGWSVPRW
jgi:hypothetical protein